jgi:putative resolvase
MNYKKAGFLRLLTMILDKQVKELVITRKDRLLRFGSEIIFKICKHLGVRITILYEEEKQEPMSRFCLDSRDNNGVYK